MSVKHPIIAITGSSGAGTSTVMQSFQHIFRREQFPGHHLLQAQRAGFEGMNASAAAGLKGGGGLGIETGKSGGLSFQDEGQGTQEERFEGSLGAILQVLEGGLRVGATLTHPRQGTRNAVLEALLEEPQNFGVRLGDGHGAQSREDFPEIPVIENVVMALQEIHAQELPRLPAGNAGDQLESVASDEQILVIDHHLQRLQVVVSEDPSQFSGGLVRDGRVAAALEEP